VLPKKNRLNKKKDLQKVFRKGKGIKESLLTFKWIYNNSGISRFAFVISKKVSKKAVLRNKIRRRLREKVRLMLPYFKEGIDGVIIANSGIEKQKKEKLIDNLNKILFRAKLIKKNKKNGC